MLDDVTGNPLITSAPTGEVRQRASLLPLGVTDDGKMTLAVPQMAFDAIDYARAPQRAYSGELPIWDPATGHTSDAARDAVTGLAGLAMTGSMPFKAPAGAIRSFGGAATHNDILKALEAEIANYTPKPPPSVPVSTFDTSGLKLDWVDRKPMQVDPTAASWDLYHGSTPGPDFARFDPNMNNVTSERGAVFFAPEPRAAAEYAGQPVAGAEAGSRVFRATVDPGKTGVFDLPHLAETDPAFNARAREIYTEAGGPSVGALHDSYMESFRNNRVGTREANQQAEAMGYAPSVLDGLSYGHGHIGAAVERAKAQGLDTAILRGLSEHGGDDQVIALTPGRVRSYYDPSQLLYSGGPAGLAGLPFLGRDR
ncbi:hypothetical protein MKK88_05765 [Methylobacterium sp. E-005]|uniref:hypothetical protein n=1 Tax=Methylobacterium sp. E-005 TaxID=2836549 RepID=UPI001FBA0C08|nr:hypothetical protein [Methylobacterium sp. E-005]MCJ2085501.1 hypothetical protein [Methylobacterium sp. E-005]